MAAKSVAAATKLGLINFPEAVHERQQRKNNSDSRNDEEAQKKIDDAEHKGSFDVVGNRDHKVVCLSGRYAIPRIG